MRIAGPFAAPVFTSPQRMAIETASAPPASLGGYFGCGEVSATSDME